MIPIVGDPYKPSLATISADPLTISVHWIRQVQDQYFLHLFVSFLHPLALKSLRFSGVNAVIFFQDPMLQNSGSIFSSLPCRFCCFVVPILSSPCGLF